MQAELTAFNQGVSKLKDYIEGLELETKLLSHDTSLEQCPSAVLLTDYQKHQALGVNKRRFDYSTIIVSLYGYLEQYLEGLLRSYTERLNAIVPEFSDLPNKIATHHLGLSMSYIDYMWRTKQQGNTTEADLISNLHSCNIGGRNYVLNKDAFAHHTANFREEVINQCFGRLEIERICDRVKSHNDFSVFIKEFFPDQDPMSILEDLADRRNQVAHGEINDLLQNPVLVQYLEFVKAFGQSLFAELYLELLFYEAQHQCLRLGSPYHVYERGSSSTVACFELINVTLKVGDRLVVLPFETQKEFFEGVVLEIQINRISYTEVAALPVPQRVGVKVSFKASEVTLL